MVVSKRKSIKKLKNIRRRDPQDEKLCLTKGQLCNIVNAAENKRGACPKAKKFIKELKAEIKEAKALNRGSVRS